MPDFSFGEILVIAIIAVIFLGPDKLPQVFVKIAKFYNTIKRMVGDAKDSLDKEVRLSELKAEALDYKNSLNAQVDKIKNDILDSTKSASEILNTPLEKQNEPAKTTMEHLELETQRLKKNLKPTNKESIQKPKKPRAKPDSNDLKDLDSPKKSRTKKDSNIASKISKKDSKTSPKAPSKARKIKEN